MKKLLLFSLAAANCMPSIDDELEQLFADEVEVKSGNLNPMPEDEADYDDQEIDSEELENSSGYSDDLPAPEKVEPKKEAQEEAPAKKIPANKKQATKVRRESDLFQKIGKLISRAAKATGRGISVGFNSTFAFCKKHPRSVTEATFSIAAISAIATLAYKLNNLSTSNQKPAQEAPKQVVIDGLQANFDEILNRFDTIMRKDWGVDETNEAFIKYTTSLNEAKAKFKAEIDKLKKETNGANAVQAFLELVRTLKEIKYHIESKGASSYYGCWTRSNWTEIGQLVVWDAYLARVNESQPQIQWPATA